ncbi:hypothetical protein E2562_026797 [Oryza meyeriana var. granulata]|uniref:FAS1 domain-containing protein n=1 Tax=Oryza meyeriana var. granulata TaxID=110450 RepID=A0A6G1CJ13_9ORYZ|nr:hypothetical protein E2562_026797 [Oryza meyeriana var. granulata]
MLQQLTTMSNNATLFSAFLLLLLVLSPPRTFAHGGVVNVTWVLVDAGHFRTFASLLAASGLERELEARQRHRRRGGASGGGITVFAPSDISFAQANPRTVRRLLAASAEDRLAVLRAHVATERLSLPELRAAARPEQPTLATEHAGGGGSAGSRFTLNVTGSGEKGPVLVSSGVVPTQVDDTLLDDGRKPAVAVFSVVDVLFPKEFFSA